jgi:hypothetical protein
VSFLIKNGCAHPLDAEAGGKTNILKKKPDFHSIEKIEFGITRLLEGEIARKEKTNQLMSHVCGTL